MIVFSSYFDALVLSVLTEHLSSGGFSGPLYNLSLALYQNNVALAPNTPFSQLAEANFSGYSRVTGLAWGNPILQPDGTMSIVSAQETFLASGTSGFVQNVIYGYALIDTANPPNVILVEAFATPIPIAAPSDGFAMAVVVNQGANSGGSAAVIISAT